MQMLCRAVILECYLPLEDVVGPFSYAILFIVPLIIATVLLYFYLPETKNRSLAQVKLEIESLPRLNNCRKRKNINKDPPPPYQAAPTDQKINPTVVSHVLVLDQDFDDEKDTEKDFKFVTRL
jgi:hypothetical protein